MKKFLFGAALLALFGNCWGHTAEMTNRLVRTMLFNSLRRSCDRLAVEGESPRKMLPELTWQTFLSVNVGEEWTIDERQSAFDRYLASLGTQNLKALDGFDQRLVQCALYQCGVFNYTNGVPSFKALALNPLGIERERAVELVLRFGRLDDEQIAFVETIAANVNVYAMLERDMALVNLYQKMEQTPPTNDVNRVARTHVAQMMYRHRHIDLAGSVVRDMACVSCFDGYATSSNRLADAQFVLARSEGPYGVWSYFSTVTNQLLSSGQPLRQLPIGEGGNE